jgi:uncharacterized protein YxeA
MKSCLTKIVLVVIIVGLSTLLSHNFVYGQSQSETQSKITLTVSYANDTDQHYAISVNPQEKYTLSQSYSWVRDQTSRYNLQAYSIDNAPYIPIPRVTRGNFTLDIPTDSSHSVLFLAVPQYPIEINGTNSVVFSPPSPTGDNWFDTNSDTQISVPNITKLEKENTRTQLKGWSIDGSDMKIVSRQESGTFSTPIIHMSSTHSINFEYATQYYINVISNFGRPTGTGWYDSGSIIEISVIPTEDFPIRHVFSEWEGSILKPNNMNSANVLVDSPKTLTANWIPDYSLVTIMGVIFAGAIIGSASIYRKRRLTQAKTPVIKDQLVKEDNESTPMEPQIYPANHLDDTYSNEITNFILQKSIEKLDSFQTSGTLLPQRHAKIKEKLSDIEPRY